jgi:hypothetical protein
MTDSLQLKREPSSGTRQIALHGDFFRSLLGLIKTEERSSAWVKYVQELGFQFKVFAEVEKEPTVTELLSLNERLDPSSDRTVAGDSDGSPPQHLRDKEFRSESTLFYRGEAADYQGLRTTVPGLE